MGGHTARSPAVDDCSGARPARWAPDDILPDPPHASVTGEPAMSEERMSSDGPEDPERPDGDDPLGELFRQFFGGGAEGLSGLTGGLAGGLPPGLANLPGMPSDP